MKKLRKSYLALAATLAVLAATVVLAPAGEVSLVWNDNPASENVTSYTVTVRNVGDPTIIATRKTDGPVNHLLVTGIPEGRAFEYRVFAENAYGKSGESDAVTYMVPPPPPPPSKPANLKISK